MKPTDPDILTAADCAQRLGVSQKTAKSDTPRGRTRDIAAFDLSISPRSIQSAITILRGGTPELIAEAKAGRLAISAAASIASLPTDEQRDLLAAGRKAVTARARQIRTLRRERSEADEAETGSSQAPEAFDHRAAQQRVRQLLRDEETRWPAEFRPALRALLCQIAYDVIGSGRTPDVPAFDDVLPDGCPCATTT